MTWQDISHLYGKKFRRATGVYRSVFEEMLNCISNYKSTQRKHPTRGGVPKLTLNNQLLMTVLYWREYRSQENMGLDFHISQSKVSRTITEIEDILIKSGSFSLPGKRVLRDANSDYEVIIVDVTETPTERPKKQKRKYSGKKKRHTLKSIIIIDAKTKKILCVAVADGKTHDFKMFKNMGLRISESIKVLADLGFLGIYKIHKNSVIPHKSSKNKPLTKGQKQENKELASQRIPIEHTNRMMKIFNILKYPYRNKQKRFGLRVNLLAAIYNKNLEINDK